VRIENTSKGHSREQRSLYFALLNETKERMKNMARLAVSWKSVARAEKE
jgi:hypothetical protein